MTAESADYGVSLGRWMSFVRRARLGDHKKRSFAFNFASYADADGTSIKAGVARLAVDTEMAFSTARRYMKWLRDVGLAEVSKVGNRKAKRADEYRLTIQPHTEAAINALSADEYRDLVDGMKDSNRRGEKTRRLSALTQEMSADDTDGAVEDLTGEDLSALTHEVSADATDSEGCDEDLSALSSLGERRSGYLRSPMSEPPPFSKRSPPTGGAPPPDPRRPQAPPASGLGTDEQNSPFEPITQPLALQRNSRPHAGAGALPSEGGVVLDMFTREAM